MDILNKNARIAFYQKVIKQIGPYIVDKKFSIFEDYSGDCVAYTILDAKKAVTPIFINPYFPLLRALENDEERWKTIVIGLLEHEMLHSAYTDPAPEGRFMEQIRNSSEKCPSLFHDIVNIMEDMVIEARAVNDLSEGELGCLNKKSLYFWRNMSPIDGTNGIADQVVAALNMFELVGAKVPGSVLQKEAEEIYGQNLRDFHSTIYQEPDDRIAFCYELYLKLLPYVASGTYVPKTSEEVKGTTNYVKSLSREEAEEIAKQQKNKVDAIDKQTSSSSASSKGQNNNADGQSQQEEKTGSCGSDGEQTSDETNKNNNSETKSASTSELLSADSEDTASQPSAAQSANEKASSQAKDSGMDSGSADNDGNSDSEEEINQSDEKSASDSISSDPDEKNSESDLESENLSKDTNNAMDSSSDSGNADDNTPNEKNTDENAKNESADLTDSEKTDNEGGKEEKHSTTDEADADNSLNQEKEEADEKQQSDTKQGEGTETNTNNISPENSSPSLDGILKKMISEIEESEAVEVDVSDKEIAETEAQQTGNSTWSKDQSLDLNVTIDGNTIYYTNKQIVGTSPRLTSLYDDTRLTEQRAINSLARKLSDIINIDEEQRFGKKGSFHLERYETRGKTSLNIFQQNREGDKTDARVLFLVDSSGSMQSAVRTENRNVKKITRMDIMKQSLVVLTEGMNKAGIPVKVMSFKRSGGVELEHYVNYSNSKKDRETLMAMQADGGTPLAEAFAYALKDIEHVRSSHKLLITITDGQPDQFNLAQKVITEAKRKKSTKIIGIGIDQDARRVKQLFTDDFVMLDDLNTFLSELTKIIEKEVQKW